MKAILATFVSSLLITGSAFAAVDLQRCEGQYLLSAFPEAQSVVNPILLQAIADGVLQLKTYNPKVGPYAVYGLEPANAQRTAEAFNLMFSVQQIQGAILECNSGLILQ